MKNIVKEKKNRMKGVIDKVIMKPTKIQPIIVNFENGEVKDKKAKKLKCAMLYDEKKDKRLLALSDGRMVYKGYQPDPKDSLTYTMFALYNKRTEKIRLIQVERWNVSPVISPPDDSESEVESDHETVGDKSAMLNKQFGSKKAKRITEQNERMRINVNSMTSQLEESVANVKVDKETLVLKVPDVTSDDSIPPCNRGASTPDDVYNLYDIIPRDTYHMLSRTVNEIKETDVTSKSKFYQQTFKEALKDHNCKRKLAILEFINGTCKWFSLQTRVGKKKIHELCPTSPDVSEYIVQTYSIATANGRQRPASIKDKAIIHCMILALMIKNYRLDLSQFSDQLHARCGTTKLKNLARLIGAVPDKTNKDVILLKCPLPAPAQIVKNNKKGAKK